MINSLWLENFKCFRKTTIKFKTTTVLVGKNNSGKSTLVEALRIVSYASKKLSTMPYIDAPYGYDVPPQTRGFHIDLRKIKFDMRGVVYKYLPDTWAKITASYNNKASVHIILNGTYTFVYAETPDGKNVKKRTEAVKFFGGLCILPQINPIRDNENRLSPETISEDKDTYLSSLHFRNELLENPQLFDKYKSLVEQTWHGLAIDTPRFRAGYDEFVTMLVRNDSFSGEVGLMGSGLQMWLQIVWFICRSMGQETIILDEPDVYMHPDMQRKIVKIINRIFPQTIIATHSVEIMSETEPKYIVSIDKYSRHQHFTADTPSAQRIIDNLGGTQNLSLVRIGIQKKVVFCEGKDVHYLSAFHDIMYPKSDHSLLSLPIVELGGQSNFNEALGAAKLFKQETQGTVRCHCILDRDYHQPSFFSPLEERALSCGLSLTIWDRKEIENYAIVPQALYRSIQKCGISVDDFNTLVEMTLDELHDAVVDGYCDDIKRADNSLQASTCYAKSREYINGLWTSQMNKIALVSGKDFFTQLNQKLSKYNIHTTAISSIKKMKANEVPEQMKSVITSLTI